MALEDVRGGLVVDVVSSKCAGDEARYKTQVAIEV